MAHIWAVEYKGNNKWIWLSWDNEVYSTRSSAREGAQRRQKNHAGFRYRVAKYIRIGRSEGKP